MLKIKHIHKSFRDKTVLDDINLNIEKSRLIALIAPNGSGKTTLLNIITNLEKADKGTVEVCGMSNTEIEIFKHLSYMQDNSVLFEDLTGWEHILLVKDIYSVDSMHIDELVHKFNMGDDIFLTVKKYSLGMKQKLLLILALLPNPSIIILDEPLNGLDPVSVVSVREILINLYKQGKTVIVSSHNLDEIAKMTKDIYFLIGGQLQHYKDILIKEKINKFEIITEKPSEFIKNISSEISRFEIISEYCCYIETDLTENNIRKMTNENTIFECRKKSKSLEQIYFELYEGYQ